MSDALVKEIFLSRVRSLLEVLSSRNSGDEESLEHDFDDLYTRANLLYHHGVRLASAHMIEEIIYDNKAEKCRRFVNRKTRFPGKHSFLCPS